MAFATCRHSPLHKTLDRNRMTVPVVNSTMTIRKQPLSVSKPSFLLGFSFGILILFITNYRNPQSVKETQLSPIGSGPTDSKSISQGFAGWHTVNVFYGEKIGLHEDLKKEYYSQVNQDKVVLDLIGDNGYFVDLAANDAKEFSNTLVLERHGWKGLCIEPNPRYWYGLSHRTCTVVGALVGATKEAVTVKFRGVYGGIVGAMDNQLANRKREPDAHEEERYTAPLVEVFTNFHVPTTIDYLSLDVEGAEYLIMKNFPFDQYQIKIMTIERPDETLKQLLEEKGFVFLKDLAWWGETLWAHTSTGFTPEHPKIINIMTVGRH